MICIEVDVYPDHDKHEEIAILSMHIRVLELIIIENAIIHSFTGRSIFINGLPLFGIILHHTEQSKIIFHFYLKDTTVSGLSALVLKRAWILLSVGIGASVFMTVPCPFETVSDAFESGCTDRSTSKGIKRLKDMEDGIDIEPDHLEQGGLVIVKRMREFEEFRKNQALFQKNKTFLGA